MKEYLEPQEEGKRWLAVSQFLIDHIQKDLSAVLPDICRQAVTKSPILLQEDICRVLLSRLEEELPLMLESTCFRSIVEMRIRFNPPTPPLVPGYPLPPRQRKAKKECGGL